MWVATSFTKKDLRKEPIGFAAKFKDGAAVARALKKGTLEILECELWMLEIVDRAGALAEARAIRALPVQPLTFKYASEKDDFFESLVRQRALYVINRNADLLPLETLFEIAACGDFIDAIAKKGVSNHPSLLIRAETIS